MNDCAQSEIFWITITKSLPTARRRPFNESSSLPVHQSKGEMIHLTSLSLSIHAYFTAIHSPCQKQQWDDRFTAAGRRSQDKTSLRSLYLRPEGLEEDDALLPPVVPRLPLSSRPPVCLIACLSPVLRTSLMHRLQTTAVSEGFSPGRS